jgi:hypothetical protein
MTTEPFYWRYATINPNVEKYNDSCLGPYSLYNGKIFGWEKPNGIYPSLYPKNASPIFDSNFDKTKIKYCSEQDKHGFNWYCTEEDAKNFLCNYYPEIFKEKSINIKYECL